MKLFIYTFLIAILFTFSVSAQNAPTKPEAVLRVEVENGKTLDLTAKDLAKFTRREVKAKAHDEKDAVFSGYNLSDILLFAGAKIGKDQLKGKELASYLLVEAADGYRAIFAIAEISTEFTDRPILLADTRDGKPLDEKNGTWQIIVPDEKKHGRWVRQVIELTIKTADTKTTANIESNTLNEDDLIREIVFRKMLEARQTISDKAYYLAVDGEQDPSENLLKRLSGYKLPVKKVSESLIFKDGVLDETTKKEGVIFSVSKIEWKSKTEVKLNAGSYIGNMGSEGCEFTLKKEKDSWKIVLLENCYVS